MHRECAYLRRGYRLPYKAKPRRLSEFLVIKMLEDENVRAGFINVADFEAAAAFDQERRHERPFDFNMAALGGVRKWPDSNGAKWINRWVIRLSRKNSKNKKPRTLVLAGDLKEIIIRRLAKQLPDCPFVFHRGGKPIRSFARRSKPPARASA